MEQSNVEVQATKDQMNQQNQIKIIVSDPQQKSQLGGTNKYYIYQLRGQDKDGAIQTTRRYSDFDLVRSTLLSRWPGFFIASIPQKKFIGNNEAVFIENRRRGLEEFLITISAVKHLWYSQVFRSICQEMQIFLKNKTQIEKPLANFGKINITQLVSRYETNFKDIQSVTITADMINKVLQFSIFLKQVLPIIENLISMAENMQIARKRHSDKYLMIIQTFFCEYETNCISQYVGEDKSGLIFTPQNFGQIIGQIKGSNSQNEQGLVNEGLKRQLRQIMSFLQTIKIRDQFQAAKQRCVGKVKDFQLQNQKILGGKSSLFSKLRNLSQDEQLKLNTTELQIARQEENNYTYICNMMNIIINTLEMEKFKKYRQKSYYSLLKKVCLYEKDSDKILNEFWTKVLAHSVFSKDK